jgi:putative molybdopterin biosynthesis protein
VVKKEKDELLTVKEASHLLKINEKKLYSLLNEGKLPGTKVTGKWLFPRAELEEFMSGKAQETVKKAFLNSLTNKKVLLLCGSDDPAIAMAQGVFHSVEPGLLLFSSSVGSREGIRLLRDGLCSIAVSHLYDHNSGEFNFPFLGEYFEDPGEIVLVNLFHRTVGYVYRKGTASNLRECAESGMRFVNRQKGSGVRALVDHLMEEEGIKPAALKGYEREVFTHFDVARSVAAGDADLGVAAESLAASAKLGFALLREERFDMIVKRAGFFDRHIQAFLEFVRSDRFSGLLKTMKGYSCRDTGRVMYAAGE